MLAFPPGFHIRPLLNNETFIYPFKQEGQLYTISSELKGN